MRSNRNGFKNSLGFGFGVLGIDRLRIDSRIAVSFVIVADGIFCDTINNKTVIEPQIRVFTTLDSETPVSDSCVEPSRLTDLPRDLPSYVGHDDAPPMNPMHPTAL